MTITIQAVYEGGVLRPLEPLRLAEGQRVDVTIAYPKPSVAALDSPNPAEDEYARRIREAKSLEEMYAIMATAAPLPEGYDLTEALNANRKATGERSLFDETHEGK
jgi:predicted DNA-binding antitoxin AbrB/MazE fold protein